MHTQDNPELNGISIGCTGIKLDEHHSIISRLPVNGKEMHGDSLLMFGE